MPDTSPFEDDDPFEVLRQFLPEPKAPKVPPPEWPDSVWDELIEWLNKFVPPDGGNPAWPDRRNLAYIAQRQVVRAIAFNHPRLVEARKKLEKRSELSQAEGS